jgi:pyruvate kinase (EC 2.7.1.40)
MTRTKIVATLGPSSSSKERIRELFQAGVDVFRFNFSHGSHADHGERFQIIRELEQAHRRPIGILADLQGPKLRVGQFANGPVRLNAGEAFRLDLDSAPGDPQRVCLPHPEIFAALAPGDMLLLDDGKIRLLVRACGESFAETDVVVGGALSNHKGVNLPNVRLPISPITEKDRDDLAFALDLGITMVALSFVQRPEDIEEARGLVGGRANLIAKMEKPSAVQHLDKIVNLADAVMVARGDLGVELPPEDVPVWQRRIVRACRRAGKPVIVATQMLESMIQTPTPTRAEASDVANAVYEGVDAVMLSGETAAGAYPVEAVTMMERIIARAEIDPNYQRTINAEPLGHEATCEVAVTAGSREMAETIGAAVIVTFTTSGDTARRTARERPPVPVMAMTPSQAVARRLSLAWGVHAVLCGELTNFREFVTEATQRAISEGFADNGSTILILAGLPPGSATNTVHIVQLDADATDSTAQ